MSDAARAFVEEYERGAPGLDWLADRRDAAIESFRRAGLPGTRQEDWKYTDLRILSRHCYRPAPSGAAPDAAADAFRFGPEVGIEMVFVNGHLAAAPAADALPAGVQVRSLAEAGRDSPALIAARLGAIAGDDARAFAALNASLTAGGAVIDIADGVLLERPLHLLFLGAPGAEAIACHPRNLIRLGANARATVIETYTGADPADYFTNAVTEAELGAGAALEHYKLQHEGARAVHVGCLAARLDRDSRIASHSVSLGALLARNDIDVRLAGEGAEAELNGLYMPGGAQHVDNHTRIDHERPRTRSREHYRGVLDGRARAVFNGKVVVHRDAQKSDADQSNANLLLSRGAEVDTKPELEIYADDVKCSHGATVGQLDEDMLFYLRSRAIPEATARALLVFAFAEDVVRPMRFRPLRDRLERGIAARLPDSGIIGGFLR